MNSDLKGGDPICDGDGAAVGDDDGDTVGRIGGDSTSDNDGCINEIMILTIDNIASGLVQMQLPPMTLNI